MLPGCSGQCDSASLSGNRPESGNLAITRFRKEYPGGLIRPPKERFPCDNCSDGTMTVRTASAFLWGRSRDECGRKKKLPVIRPKAQMEGMSLEEPFGIVTLTTQPDLHTPCNKEGKLIGVVVLTGEMRESSSRSTPASV